MRVEDLGFGVLGMILPVTSADSTSTCGVGFGLSGVGQALRFKVNPQGVG